MHEDHERQKPVALSTLASKALKEVEGLDAATWAGYGGFRKLVEALQLPKLTVDWEAGTVHDPARHSVASPRSESQAKDVPLDAVLPEVTRLIRSELEQAGRPVSCARLAKMIVDQHATLAADWGGKGSFRKFLDGLDLAPLEVSWENGGGQIRDSRIAAVEKASLKPASSGAADWDAQSHLFPVIQQIHSATGMPLLAPKEMQGLLDALVVEVKDQPFALSDTGKRVRDRCREAGLGVSRSDVSYVLKGILLAGHEFRAGNDNISSLSSRFIDSMRVVCAGEQMTLDDAAEGALREWSSGGYA